MARPKRLKKPTRLEVLIERTSKSNAFILATERKISIGRLFEMLVQQETDRLVKRKPELASAFK